MSLDPVSIFVKNQLPSFFQTEGPKFVAFIQAYYEWLEQQGQVLGYSRNLLSYRDVDTTLDLFLDYFKSEFLSGIKYKSNISNRDLIKHAVEFYKAKGSSRATQLLFLLLFNENSEVYFPGQDILRPSDGTWYIPKYLELSRTDKAFTFPGKSILGTRSGATALVERVDRKTIKGKVFDVAFITNAVGLFVTGEKIVLLNDGVVRGAPTVIGSLTNIDIAQQGRDFSIGDILDVVSPNKGVQGKIRVTGTENATGRVSFAIQDGGSGYTNTATVYVSEKVLGLSFTNANRPVFGENIKQNLELVETLSPNATFNASQTLIGSNNTTNIAFGKIVQSNTTFITVQNTSGTFANASITKVSVNATAGAIPGTVTNVSANAIIIGSNTTSVGLHGITGTFYSNTLVFTTTSNTHANVNIISTGSGATFSVALLSDTEQVFLNADRLAANNTSNVPYMSISLNASAYGFPKLPTGNSSNILSQVLTFGTYTLGTIATIKDVNPGTNYNTDPFVQVVDGIIAPFNRKNIILTTANTTGNFIIGEDLTQQYNREKYSLTLNSVTGVFDVNETVQQVTTTGTVLGQVESYDSVGFNLNVFSVNPYQANSAGGGILTGLTSGATANVTGVYANTSDVFTKGVVLNSSNTSITLKRLKFNTAFAEEILVIGETSGATAKVIDVNQIARSPIMGNNAIITANAGIANGVITDLEVIDSGFAYNDTELVSLQSSNNIYIGTGIVRLRNQGIGEGYWTSTRGFLNNKYLHDNDYYQDYSYDIKSALSLTRYKQIITNVAHVAGTKMFGSVVTMSEQSQEMQVTSEITLT